MVCEAIRLVRFSRLRFAPPISSDGRAPLQGGQLVFYPKVDTQIVNINQRLFACFPHRPR